MKKVIISMLMLVTVVAAHAQGISEEYAAEVRKALQLQHTTETLVETMRLQMQQLVDKGTMTVEGVNGFCQEMGDIMYPALEKRITDLYYQNLSLDELRQMNAYLSSPVGQKGIKLAPMFAAEGAKVAQSPEIQGKIMTIMSKYIKK